MPLDERPRPTAGRRSDDPMVPRLTLMQPVLSRVDNDSTSVASEVNSDVALRNEVRSCSATASSMSSTQ
jgi:hypothetical protein